MTTEATNIFSKKNQYRKQVVNEEESSGEKEILAGVTVRVSTEMQAIDGDSLEMQQELAEEHVNKINGKLVKLYIEEGLSASKIRIEKRTKIQELMNDIEEGRVNYVIAYKRDRMFRNSIEHMQFLQFLADHDCDIYFSARGEMQLDLSGFKASGVSKMMESMLSMMAEMESAVTSARVSDTMISKASRGERTGGRIPLGYEYDGDEIVPIDGAKEIIEIIEDLYLSGYGVKSISKWLNGGKVRGLKSLDTPYPKLSRHSTSKDWNHRNVETVLFNPIYTGHNSYQSRKNSEMDRIVEKSSNVTPLRTMERQQQIFDLQRKKTEEKKPPRAYNTPFLLTGIVYCGECGLPLKTQTSQKSDGVRYSYYKCGRRHTDKAEKCEMGRIYRKEIIEKIIIELTKSKLTDLWNEEAYELYKKKSEHNEKVNNNQLETIENKINDLNKKVKKYAILIVELEDDIELKELYLQEQKESLKELNKLKEARIKIIEESNTTEEEKINFEKFLEVAKKYPEAIDKAPMGKQKQILETLFDKIYINKEGEVTLDFNFGIKSNMDEGLDNDTHVGGKLKTPSFIGFDTIREGTVPKDINVDDFAQTLDTTEFKEWTTSFNYFEILRKMFEQARTSFYPFLCQVDPKFDIRNVDSINEDELIEFTPSAHKRTEKTKKLYSYIQQKLNITKTTRTRLVYGHLPPYKKMKQYLSTLNSNVGEYFLFVKKQYPDFILDENLFNEVEASVNSKSVKTLFLFKDLIKCQSCGSFYVGKKEGKGVRYVCPKNRYGKKDKCASFRVKEPILINMFESEMNVKISRALLLDHVEEIIVNENDNAIFKYKNSGETNAKNQISVQ